MDDDVPERAYIPGTLLQFVARDGRITHMLHGDYLVVLGKNSETATIIEVIRVRGTMKMWWASSNLNGLCVVIDT